MDRAELKARAKQNLGGGIFQSEWLNGVLIVFIYGLISSIGSVAIIIIYGPLLYGFSKVFLDASRGQGKLELGKLFAGFSEDFGGNLVLGLLQTIFVSLWSLLFVIPGIVMSYAYSFAFFVKADHPDYDWKQCLDESKSLTNGHKGDLFVLDLSFIGWFIVGSLAFGVGYLWVTPYLQMTKAEYYDQLRGQSQPVPEGLYPEAPSAEPYQ